MTDILEIKRRLEGRAGDVAERLLPNGKRQGREWCVGSIDGEIGESLKVCISGAKAGVWADFAAGTGGDLIDLWMAVHRCDLTMALDEIRTFLGMEQPVFEKAEKSYRRPEPPRGHAPKSDVLAYLTGERKLTAEAIKAFRIGEDGRNVVFQSFLPNGTLAFVKRLGLDRPNGKKVVHVEADCEPVLFGWQAMDPKARTVCLTEGEIDAVSAHVYGIPSLSVPFGGGKGAKQGNWIEAEFDRLSRFETIFLALDMDEEGEAGAEEICNRLGRHRCRRVSLPMKDMNACLQAGIPAEQIRACLDAAKTMDPPELVRAGAFADDVVRLFWPPEGEEPGYRLPWAKVRDRLVFRPGELTIWTGATGAGKSQMLSHAVVEMGDQGAKVCIASLEMAPKQLLRRMVKQAGNVDRGTEEYIRKIVAWMDGWLWLFGVVGKSPILRLLEVFEYARARYGCDVFVVDSVMRLGVGAEDYEGQEKAVYQIVSWAVEKNVHVHLVAHARKADRQGGGGAPEAEDVKGASEIASNAFNILGVWRNRKLEDDIKAAADSANAGDIAAQEKLKTLIEVPPVVLNVSKQRNGDWEGKCGLWFCQDTYQYHSAMDNKDGRQYVSGPRIREAWEVA